MFAGFQLQFLSKYCTWCGISFSPKRGDRVHRTCSCGNVNTWPYHLNYNLICLSLNNSATVLGTLFYTSHSIKTLNNSAFPLFLASKKNEKVFEKGDFFASLFKEASAAKKSEVDARHACRWFFVTSQKRLTTLEQIWATFFLSFFPLLSSSVCKLNKVNKCSFCLFSLSLSLLEPSIQYETVALRL